MELGTPGWVVLGTSFRCSGLPAQEGQALAAMLQGFPRLEPSDPAAVELRVGPGDEPGQLALTAAQATRWDLPAGAAAVSAQVEYRIIDEAVRRAREQWILHAGAVASPRGTCLIVGESGAGKTSLTLWLWAGGLRLATDDLCPLAHGSLQPEAFPRSLHMDAEYSPTLLRAIPPRPAGYPAGYYPFPGSAAEELPPVADLIVIERGPEPAGELRPLGKSEAVHRLTRAIIKTPGFDYENALADMIRLAARCRAHLLRSATPAGAAARARDLLAGG